MFLILPFFFIKSEKKNPMKKLINFQITHIFTFIYMLDCLRYKTTKTKLIYSWKVGKIATLLFYQLTHS